MKRQIVNQFNAFATDPASRTADVINSVEVLAIQAYVYNTLTAEQKQLKSDDPQQLCESQDLENANKFSRFAVEELLRRKQKIKDKVSSKQILEIIYPDFKKVCEEHRVNKKNSLDSAGKSSGKDSEDKFAEFAALANTYRAQVEG